MERPNGEFATNQSRRPDETFLKLCSSGALVVAYRQLALMGRFAVRRGELKTDQIAGCPGLKMPAQVVFYQARAGATGSDHLVYEVTNPTGEVGTFDVTIKIKNPPEQVKPSSGSKI